MCMKNKQKMTVNIKFFYIAIITDASGIYLSIGKGGNFEGRVELVKPGVDAPVGSDDSDDVERGQEWISEA